MLLYVYSMLRCQGRSTQVHVFVIRALDPSPSLCLRFMIMCIPRLEADAAHVKLSGGVAVFGSHTGVTVHSWFVSNHVDPHLLHRKTPITWSNSHSSIYGRLLYYETKI
jgi:hypothetical protein